MRNRIFLTLHRAAPSATLPEWRTLRELGFMPLPTPKRWDILTPPTPPNQGIDPLPRIIPVEQG